MRKIFLMCLLVLLCSGCSIHKVNVSKSNFEKNIDSIALLPGGGVAADAIGIELMQYGFNIYDTETTSSIMIRLNLEEIEFSDPINLKKLSDMGINSILKVKTVSGYDDRPNTIVVKLVDTDTAQLIVGANWQNGKGAAKGSAVDGWARTDIANAAKKIAKRIGTILKAK